MTDEIERPENCGECQRFLEESKSSKYGYCDNWAGVRLERSCVCHPNMGRKRKGA